MSVCGEIARDSGSARGYGLPHSTGARASEENVMDPYSRQQLTQDTPVA